MLINCIAEKVEKGRRDRERNRKEKLLEEEKQENKKKRKKINKRTSQRLCSFCTLLVLQVISTIKIFLNEMMILKKYI